MNCPSQDDPDVQRRQRIYNFHYNTTRKEKQADGQNMACQFVDVRRMGRYLDSFVAFLSSSLIKFEDMSKTMMNSRR